MEHDRSDGETSNNAKRIKLDEEEEDDNPDQLAVAIAADGAEEGSIADTNDVSSSSIFKLDIDCCEELFALLPLTDLHSLGQTCKRMHQYTGYFVRENYKSTRFEWKNGNLYFNEIQMNCFIEFISNLSIWSKNLKQFAEFAPRFKSIRKLRLYLGSDQTDCIKEILHKCEEIEIMFGDNVLNIDLYEKILKFCTNLKDFTLNPFSTGNVLGNNNWLLHKYPNLESLDLYSESYPIPTNAMKTFFTLNKGIRKFQTNDWNFQNCRHWIMNIDIKLDELLIDFRWASSSLNREYNSLLNTLYERGFYKHLSLLQVFGYDSSILAEIRAPLKMELLMCRSPLPTLDLKELRFHYKAIVDPKTILANNFSTIERIHLAYFNVEKISFCIGNFIKLREIKINYLKDKDLKSFNVKALNEERKKLIGARSVTIYLGKTTFNKVLKTSGLELIKIKSLKSPVYPEIFHVCFSYVNH